VRAKEILRCAALAAARGRCGKRLRLPLITGDYVRSGLPLSLFLMAGGRPDAVYLQRTGANAKLSYEYTAVTAPNGKVLVAPNCLQCHAQVFDGKLYIGLGNTSIDFSDTKKLNPKNCRPSPTF
jgi:mono/diheme cytochrome c family protein